MEESRENGKSGPEVKIPGNGKDSLRFLKSRGSGLKAPGNGKDSPRLPKSREDGLKTLAQTSLESIPIQYRPPGICTPMSSLVAGQFLTDKI